MDNNLEISQKEKEKIIQGSVEMAAYVLTLTMKTLGIENFISGIVENSAGERYKLEFRKEDNENG